MGYYSGVRDAKIFEKGQWFPAGGVFVCRTKKVLTKQTENSGPCFIVEFEVLESNHPEVHIGASHTWVQSLTKANIALPAIKAFMVALLRVDTKDEEAYKEFSEGLEESLDATEEDETLLAGLVVELETFNKVTKSGNDFTVHKFTPYEGSEHEDIEVSEDGIPF